MRIRRLFCTFIAVSAVMLTALTQVQAYQARYIVQRFNNDCKEGSARDIRGSFTVRNITKQTIQLDAQSIQGPEFEFRLVADQKILRPNEEVTVHFIGSIRADGKYQVNTKLGLQVGSEFRTEQELDLYFIVENGQFRLSTYEEVYLQHDVIDQVRGNAFLSVEDDGRIRRGVEYQQPLPSVQQMIEMDPNSIFRIPLDSADPQNCGPGDCRPNRTLDKFTEKDIVIRGQRTEHSVANLANVIARGEFNWRGMDNLLHPAFGWRVRAWQRPAGGGWSVVAEDWIQWDGKWQLNVPVPDAGTAETQFQYVAFNRFFTPQTSGGDTYRWVGPVRASLSSPHNEGSWIANTSTGNVRGLGEIYREGMVLWSKLYWEGEINPLRSESIRVFFPNTTYDCGDGSGSPWSCASINGRIWLIPAHASRNGVMQHELAHQINYQYWGNARPPGSGGSHNLVDCFNPGLALTEGFANFMVFWTQAGRASDPNSGFDFRPENPSFACADPSNENESWVAGAFWDLHDTRFDGSDNLWFIHPGATPAIFLRGGVKNGMANFYPEYRSRANVEHRPIIDAMFQQNQIID